MTGADVEDVALGHETRLRWNTRDAWIFSNDRVHEPIIDTETFERARDLLDAPDKPRAPRGPHREPPELLAPGPGQLRRV